MVTMVPQTTTARLRATTQLEEELAGSVPYDGWRAGTACRAFQPGYHGVVRARSVSIADLRNNLTTYIGRVRRGDEILVRDRNVPVAKIVPLGDTADVDAEEAALAAEGKLRLSQGPLPASFWKRRAPRVASADVLRAVRADRDEG